MIIDGALVCTYMWKAIDILGDITYVCQHRSSVLLCLYVHLQNYTYAISVIASSSKIALSLSERPDRIQIW